ncbi:hypothetical protein EZMO1_2434 [Endozoicomonas montiporae CL-33]|nr:hypothetical protein EZMO1_2434 [Endozoicomonas montiporae CL-33]
MIDALRWVEQSQAQHFFNIDFAPARNTKMTIGTPRGKTKKQENFLLNILLNVAIPSLILTKLSGEAHLGAFWGLIVALIFPITYGIYDFCTREKVNFFSIFGFISTLLTGIIGLLELSKSVLILKETSMPLLIMTSLILFKDKASSFMKEAFSQAIDFNKIEEAIGRQQLDKKFSDLMLIFKGAFLVSASLNFFLTSTIIQSEPGTSEYTAELGRMVALSTPVIAIPCTAIMMIAIYRFFNSISAATGLSTNELIQQ